MGIEIKDYLLEILACPVCEDRPRVVLTDTGLKCESCGRVYPVENGVPVMLPEKATVEEK